jgi:Flp pilus assembly protein protease CpaA
MGNSILDIFPHHCGRCSSVPQITQKASYNPLMISITPGSESILPLLISLCVVIWLCACAVIDVRTHLVPNALTLPAIPLACLTAWLTRGMGGETIDEFLFHLVILILPLFAAWSKHLLGGADLKILVVLSLANPQLTVAAWVGVMVYFFVLMILRNNRPARFAGVPGFALGIAAFTIGQMAMFFTQHLAAG